MQLAASAIRFGAGAPNQLIDYFNIRCFHSPRLAAVEL